MFTFKTEAKTFTDEVDFERTVVGIKARIINIDIDLSGDFRRDFYIVFELSTGDEYGARNSNTIDFAKKAINSGLSQEQANIAVKEICRKLEYGTIQDVYDAAQQLAGMYGYVLKPLNQQD